MDHSPYKTPRISEVPGGRPAAVLFEALRPRRRAPRGAGGGAQDAGGGAGRGRFWRQIMVAFL